MPATKILLIRHAAKPSEDGKLKGVSAAGAPTLGRPRPFASSIN